MRMLTSATEENNTNTIQTSESHIGKQSLNSADKNVRQLYTFHACSCVRKRRATILGQKVAAKRPSSSKVRVHNSDKARTGSEKIFDP